MSIYNVKDYGAQGNGTGDDTAALQACINDAQQNYGTIFIPAGIYPISARLNVTAPCAFVGEGFASQLSLMANIVGIYCIAPTPTVLKGMLFRDFSILGNGFGLPSSGLLQLQACEFLIDHLWIQGSPSQTLNNGKSTNGIGISNYSIDNYTVASQGAMVNCLIENTTKGGLDWTGSAINALISGNIFRCCGGQGQTPGCQIGGGFNGMVIGNACYGNEGAGIFLMTQVLSNSVVTPPLNCVIQGNHCYGNGVGGRSGNGISVVNGYSSQAGSRFGNIVIQGNVCYGDKCNHGIMVQNMQNVILNGNHCYKNAGNGVMVQLSNYVTLSGNQLFSNGYAGVEFLNSDQLLVNGNLSFNDVSQLSQRYGFAWLSSMTNVVSSANNLSGTVAAQTGFVPAA